MFKTETHLHTKPVSSCSRFEPEEMIRLHKNAGYSTVFVSDHFARHHFDKLGENLSWNELIDIFFGAFEKAKAEGDKIGLRVLLSAELSLHNNHYLLYKINKEFFRNRPDIFEISASEFYKYAKENGVVVIQAHPLRDGVCVPEPDCVDGFEVINTNPRHENFDDEILALAKKYKKPMTAGSDAHRIEDIGASGVLTEKEICSVDDYLDILFSGGLKLIRGEEIL